jgi:predicted O-methyltransferase YrrM
MKPPRFFRRFDYKRTLLPNSFIAKLEEGVKDTKQAIEKTGHTIGYPGWNIIYYLLLAHLKPNQHNIVVETGSNIGCTTVILAQAIKDSLGDGRLYSVELEADNFDKAKRNLLQAGVAELVDIRQGDSKEILRQLSSELPGIRAAFLDASHLLNDVLTEFEIIYPLLDEDSIVIFDNTYQIADEGEDPRVFGALKQIQDKYGGNLINLQFVSWYTPGLAIWQQNPFPC